MHAIVSGDVGIEDALITLEHALLNDHSLPGFQVPVGQPTSIPDLGEARLQCTHDRLRDDGRFTPQPNQPHREREILKGILPDFLDAGMHEYISRKIGFDFPSTGIDRIGRNLRIENSVALCGNEAVEAIFFIRFAAKYVP